jgi:hypothetical protein
MNKEKNTGIQISIQDTGLHFLEKYSEIKPFWKNTSFSAAS